MLDGLLRRWRTRSVESIDSLKVFLDRRASLIAQKSVIGYCQVKTRLPLHELTIEQQFASAFEHARWEGFAAILADLVVIVEGYLRPLAPGRESALAESLARLFADILQAHPLPEIRPQGWADTIEAVRQRLIRAQLAPPATIAVISQTGAEHLYAALPIHESLRAPDKPAILANVQFLMVGLAHEFEAQLNPAALATELLTPALSG